MRMIDEIFEWVQSVNTLNYLDAGRVKLVSLQRVRCAVGHRKESGSDVFLRAWFLTVSELYQK